MKKITLLAGILLLLVCSGASANCHPGHVEGGEGHQHEAGSVRSLNDLGKQFSSMLEAASATSGQLARFLDKGAGGDVLKRASGIAEELAALMEELSTIMFLGSAEEKDVNDLKAKLDQIRSRAESLQAAPR